MVYIGSAESQDFDQELASVMVGPVPRGVNRFVMEVRTRGRLRQPWPA